MTRRTVLYVAIAFLVLASGCGPCHRLLLCDPSNCSTPAAGTTGPCVGECETPVAVPGVVRPAPIAPWRPAVWGPGRPYYGRGLLGWLFALFRPHGAWCDGGCGPRYWGGWLSDPPDCCDPCDRCGNWVGSVGAVSGPAPVGPVLPAGALPPSENCPNCNRQVGPMARLAVRAGMPAGTTPPLASGASARPAARMVSESVMQPWLEDASPGVITDPNSPYAPRLISVTDRVLVPAAGTPAEPSKTTTEPAPRQRVAQQPQAGDTPRR